MEFPNEKLSREEVIASPFCGEGSIIVTENGIRRVSIAQWRRSFGLPNDGKNIGKILKLISGSKAKVKFEDGTYLEAA